MKPQVIFDAILFLLEHINVHSNPAVGKQAATHTENLRQFLSETTLPSEYEPTGTEQTSGATVGGPIAINVAPEPIAAPGAPSSNVHSNK